MMWLRWANLGVAIAAGAIANLSGAAYAENEPETAWGPWTYVALAWATSALAFGAWLPKPLSTQVLAVDAVASAAWFGYMLQFGVFNLPGHFLAAVFFAATACEDARGTDAGKTGVARWMARTLWWPAVAALLAAALFIPVGWATGYLGAGQPTAQVLTHAAAVGALTIIALLSIKPGWRASWMRPAVVVGAAALAVLSPDRYVDPMVGLLAAAAAFGACSVALELVRSPATEAPGGTA